jgi:hypothetical protein
MRWEWAQKITGGAAGGGWSAGETNNAWFIPLSALRAGYTDDLQPLKNHRRLRAMSVSAPGVVFHSDGFSRTERTTFTGKLKGALCGAL